MASIRFLLHSMIHEFFIHPMHWFHDAIWVLSGGRLGLPWVAHVHEWSDRRIESALRIDGNQALVTLRRISDASHVLDEIESRLPARSCASLRQQRVGSLGGLARGMVDAVVQWSRALWNWTNGPTKRIYIPLAFIASAVLENLVGMIMELWI